MVKIRLLFAVCWAMVLAGCATTHRPVSNVTYYTYPASSVEAAMAPVKIVTANIVPAIVSATGTGVTYHTVKQGETLWSISKMYNVSLDSLAKANSIADTRVVEKGRVLVIPSAQSPSVRPTGYVAAKRPSFAWPVRGTVVSRFGETVNSSVNKGIDISAAEGGDVVAAKAGRVVYCDSYFKGFGQTVIIDHAEGYQTVYSYNSEILVKVGDAVRQNQTIAKVGESGRARIPMLHFEIRFNGESQDPLNYLPK